jgi:16S rRNA (uracil1498-N3)-methyltransferase
MADSLLELPAPVARHAVRVLRLPMGAGLTLFDGQGSEYPAAIEAIEKERVTVRLGERQEIERESSLRVTLAQAMQAAEKMDYTLQKAVELGVAAFLPLTGRRSVARLEGERAEKRRTHWHGVAVAACEQCGRTRIPEVGVLSSLENWLQGEAKGLPGLKLLLLPEGTRTFSELTKPAPDVPITLLVGAEGGLDPVEIAAAQQAGFILWRLGSRILRTETAGMAALAILQSHWGDL